MVMSALVEVCRRRKSSPNATKIKVAVVERNSESDCANIDGSILEVLNLYI